MWIKSTFLLYAIALASAKGDISRSDKINDEYANNQSSGPKKVEFEEKLHQYQQDTASSDDTNEIKLVYDYLESGNTRVMKDIRYEDVVLVLGNSGAGKSTIVQLLTGNNTNLISEKKCYVFKKKTRCNDDFQITDTNNKIGSNVIYSHTEIPERVFDSNTNTTFYDCPGFSDNRDAKHDIGRTYFIKKVIDNAKTVKFLFVVDYAGFTGMDEKNFMRLAKHATNLIQNITKFKDSIAMVATKVNEHKKRDKEIISTITQYLEQAYLVPENQGTSSTTDKKVMQFVDILLTVDNNNDYPRIGFFRKPKKSGPLSNIIEAQENKQLINNILHKSIKYTEHNNADDFGYTISNNSKMYVNGLVEQINKNILVDSENIANELTEYYKNLTEKIINKIDSFITDDDKINVPDTDYSFLTKLDTASNTISTLVKEINNATTPAEFSNKITHSIDILNIPITTSDSTSDILTQGEYLNFFRDVAKFNTSLNQKELQSCFQGLKITLDHLKRSLYTSADKEAHQIKNLVKSNMEDSEMKIQNYFSNVLSSQENPKKQQEKNLETSAVQALANNLHEIEKQINETEVTNMVFVLGDTVAGKADFVKYVTGNNSNLIPLPVKFFNYNKLIFDVETNTTFYICPEYGHPQGEGYDIFYANYLMKKIANHAKAFKFIFVIPHDSFNTSFSDRENPVDFLSLAQYATKIIKNIPKFKDSIALIVSNVKDNYSDEMAISGIVTFLKEVKNNQIQQNDDLGVQFIEALLTESNGTDEIYPKIGFMRESKVPLNDTIIEIMRNQTISLKNLLHKNVKYIEHGDEEDFGYIIPSRIYSYIIKLQNEIDKDILFNIRNITNTLKGYYQNLMQNMMDKIDSLDNDTVIMSDTDISEAEKFSIKIKRWKNNLTTLVDEISKSVTTPKELSARINNTVAFLNVSVSQESISNIFSRAKDYEFLKTIDGLWSSSWEWASPFNDLVNNDMEKLETQLDINVPKMVIQIKNKINANIINSGKEIEKYFSRKEETVYDIEKLVDDMSSGYDKVSGTRKAINKFDSSFECIEKISDNFFSFNNSDENIISAVTILQITRKYDYYFRFFRALNGHLENYLFICSDEAFELLLDYLHESKVWYQFMIGLNRRLSSLIQTNELATCQNLANDIIYREENKTIKDIKLEPFAKECCREKIFFTVNYIKLDKVKLKNLKKMIDSSLKNDIEYFCDSGPSKGLLIKGRNVNIGAINKHNCLTSPRFIEIFALQKIIFDVDFDKKGKKVDLTIIAPVWDIKSPFGDIEKSRRNIILDGEPGLLGAGSAGNFVGINNKVNSVWNLFIYANGFKSRINNSNNELDDFEDGESGEISVFSFENNNGMRDICTHQGGEKTDVNGTNTKIFLESIIPYTINRYKNYVKEYLVDRKIRASTEIDDFYNQLENYTFNQSPYGGSHPYCRHDIIIDPSLRNNMNNDITHTTTSSTTKINAAHQVISSDANNIKSPINAGINWLLSCILEQLKLFYTVNFL